MKKIGAITGLLTPAIVGLAAFGVFSIWFWGGSTKSLVLRIPGSDHAPGGDGGTNGNAVLAGKLIRSAGQPASLAGTWPQFRGPNRDGISPESVVLSRNWAAGGPRELWAVDLGEGYAGAAVLNGRAYVMDYDREKKQDALRCLSLEDGREIWRYAYPVNVKRNHGMSRTVPAVSDELVVAMGPKCNVVCLDAVSGELRWGLDLVLQYGTTVPPWYAGQCPLIDKSMVILAPAGKSAFVVGLEGKTGKELWRCPNPQGWKMTHSSLVPMEFNGERMYVYCGNNGVVGVSAKDGRVLWETSDWKISIATVPSPLILDGGRIFLSGGYDAGSLMLQLVPEGDRFAVKTVFRLEPSGFGATQHTPVVYQNHIYGVRADGRFVCLDLDGKLLWASDPGQSFGLGPFLVADGMVYAMNDAGLLRLIEATPERYKLLGQAQVLNGRESWGPLALAGGRLLARDLTRMVCLEVGKP
jgi:outer membrane protein assembly factor BamB